MDLAHPRWCELVEVRVSRTLVIVQVLSGRLGVAVSQTRGDHGHKKRSPFGLLAFRFHLPESGRAGEIRTHDLLHPMQAFYQAELQPASRFGLFGGTAVWRVVKRFQVPDAIFPKHSAGTSWNRVGEGIVPALRWVRLAWPQAVLSLSQTPLRSASTVSHIARLLFAPQLRAKKHPSPQNQARSTKHLLTTFP